MLRSTTVPVTLSALELDALTELVNLGVGNAAIGLREMIQQEIILTVPRASIMTREEAITNLQQTHEERLVAVNQNFEGAISGRALLIFAEAQSMDLVRLLVGSDLSAADLMDLELEALAETGNVVLNACLGTIANNLQRSLRLSLPEVVHGDGSDFFDLTSTPKADDTVLFIFIRFAVRHRDISGYLAMLLDLPSLIALKNLLAEFIDRLDVVADAPLAIVTGARITTSA